MRSLFLDVRDVLFPRYCLVCGAMVFEAYEKFMCIQCFSNLPLSIHGMDENNPIYKVFWGRCRIEFAYTLMNYQRNSVYAELFKEIKYRNRIDLAFYLGCLVGKRLQKRVNIEDKEAVALIPVPLAKRKKWIRGYNQAEVIANGISKVTGMEVLAQTLLRRKHKSSQTAKSRLGRWNNIKSVYTCKKITEKYQHIILVDDVVTTGATIEACYHVIKESNGIRISVVSLGFTENH